MVELISVHIPKTAGTAFRHILTDVYGMIGVLGDYPPDRIHQPEQLIDSQIRVIHGHFTPSKYQEYYPQAKRIVWLRHPIFRLISEYFFAKTIKDHNNAIHAQLLDKNLNILEFAQIPKMRNFLAQNIKGMKLSQFDFVGVQEFYLEDLKDLQQMMKWPAFKPEVKNNNRYPQYQKCLEEILSNSTLINQLAKLNLEDLNLYQEALNLRAKRRQELPLIQPILADWQRSQFLLVQTQQELIQAQLEAQQYHYWLKQKITPAQELDFIPAPKSDTINQLVGFHLDSPPFPTTTHHQSITINGWVIGKESPATKIIIRHHNQILATADINLSRPDVAQVYTLPDAKHSGFETFLVTSAISHQTKLTIEVILANSDRITLGILSLC